MIFTEFYTYLGINFEKNIDLNSAYLFSRGGSSEPLEPPLATGVLIAIVLKDNDAAFLYNC